MGIIILPFLLGAVVLGIRSIVKVIGKIENKQIETKEILFGLAASLIFFGLICLSYIIEGRASPLSPAFRIPIFMVFIPFIIQIATEKSKKSSLAYLSKILLISIGITVILGVIFNNFFLGLIDYLGIEKVY